MIDNINWVIKIVDYGGSSFFHQNEKFDERIGTPYYIAPEVLEGFYDYKCDNWSLGVILYVLLSGKPPFYGRNELEIFSKIKANKYSLKIKELKNLSPEGEDLIKRFLLKDVDKRIDLKDALEHAWFKKHLK